MRGRYKKIIIIGAGRSGTNMLRDVLTSLPNVVTWNCDEINPIWKIGNRNEISDELDEGSIKEDTTKLILKEFDKLAARYNASYVVEKTCANSLRVPYVFKILPDAYYIFIHRDGRDVVPSAVKRWTSKLDVRYTLKKLRYVPKSDLLFYIRKFGLNRIMRLLHGKKSLSFWGPFYEGMDRDVRRHTLDEVCAKQWAKCTVNSLISAHSLIPEEQRIIVSYEGFVSCPEGQLQKILEFVGMDYSEIDLGKLVENVSNRSVGLQKKTGYKLDNRVVDIIQNAEEKMKACIDIPNA